MKYKIEKIHDESNENISYELRLFPKDEPEQEMNLFIGIFENRLNISFRNGPGIGPIGLEIWIRDKAQLWSLFNLYINPDDLLTKKHICPLLKIAKEHRGEILPLPYAKVEEWMQEFICLVRAVPLRKLLVESGFIHCLPDRVRALRKTEKKKGYVSIYTYHFQKIP